ncbi:FtsX-like permease family protein [Nonomuraea sp. NPDC059194]|uniref:FtsX-like permease family protein n=1 Tax=Nonomuraea sp. NPDC059194 TaxID=3346764 RepID=UPI0036C69FE0
MRGRTSWVLKRAAGEPLLPLTAFAAILLATTTLVALSIYISSVVDVGVRWSVTQAGRADTSAEVTTWIKAESFAQTDADVHAQAAESFPRFDPRVVFVVNSGPYQAEGGERLPFGTRSDLESAARLVQGEWARPGEPLQATLPQETAQRLGVSAGQELTVRRRETDPPLKVLVTGVFATPDTLYPRLDAALMVPRQTFLERFTDQVLGYWYVLPDLKGVATADLGPLSAAAAALPDRLKARPGCADCTVRQELPAYLAQLDRGALVGQSTMLVPVLQLLILAGYSLMLTARMLAERRRMEVALLRARGAGMGGLVSLSLTEALLIALPSVAIAPFVAPHVLNGVSGLLWTQAAAVRVPAAPEPVTFAIAGAAALAGAALLAGSAVRSARRTYVEEQSARGRGDRRGMLARAGGDLALLVVAGLAVWQLTRYGSPVTATAGGVLGIDPMLVTGPALALLSGGMLGMRLVPWTSRLVSALTSRRTTLAPALGAWQVSRRPLRYVGPALLLTMAVAIGVLSITTTTTWESSQRDQAAHRVGADLRIVPVEGQGQVGGLGAGRVYAGLPGVSAVSPAVRDSVAIGSGSAELLALDADRLESVMNLREDLSATSLADMAKGLKAGRPGLGAAPIPGTPSELTVSVRTRAPAPLDAKLLITDADGVRRQLDLADRGAGGDRTLVADLAPLAGADGKIAYPLALRGFLFGQTPAPVAIGALRAGGADVRLPGGLSWAGFEQVGRFQGSGVGEGAAKPVRTGQGDLFGIDAVPERGKAVVLAVPAGVPPERLFGGTVGGRATLPQPLPVVVTAELAAQEKLSAGARLFLPFDATTSALVVVAVVDSLPGLPVGEPGLLADLPTLADRNLLTVNAPPRITEWWAAADDPGAVTRALAAHPGWSSRVLDRQSVFAELRDDPLAGGLQGALLVGFVAAVIFAGLGFAVNAAVAARERSAELGLLHALGVSFRQVLGLLAVEQTFLIGLGLAGGTLLAGGMAAVVVPHLVLSGQVTAVTPPVRLDIPWAQTAILLAVIATGLFAIVAALAGSLRRRGLVRARHTEEGS